MFRFVRKHKLLTYIIVSFKLLFPEIVSFNVQFIVIDV